MEGKLLNHVEFKFLRTAYPLHEKLYCYFQTPVVSQWQPEIGDWVGLYKVGWSALKEHKIRKQIQQEWLENRKNVNVDYVHVVFEQHELPRDVDGLYQFVYVSKMNVVKGVSTPFRFELPFSSESELRQGRLYPQQQQQQQQQVVLEQEQEQIRVTERELPIEGEITKDTLKEYLNIYGLDETSVNGRLMRKYLNSVRSIQNDDITKKVEELFFENGKLCNSLKSRIQEVSELKKECDDIKTVNVDLLTKLANAERKVEQLEREKELNVRRIEEITRDVSRVGLQGRQTKRGELLVNLLKGVEKSQVELYDELETPIDAKIKLVQRVVEEPVVLPTSQRERLIERLRDGEITPSHANRFLKRVVEDINNEREQTVRQMESMIENVVGKQQQQQHQQQQQVFSRIGLVPMGELVGEQQQQQRPRSMTLESLPSISVSTVVPEQKIKSITITKVEQPREWQRIQHQQQKELQRIQQQQQQQQRLQKILEPVQIQSVIETKPWQQVEPKQWQQVEPKQWQSLEQRPWQSLEQRQWQSLEQRQQQQSVECQKKQLENLAKQWQTQQQQQQQQWQSEKQQILRGHVGEYLNRLDEQIRSKIEERLRNKLQEQLEGKIEKQQQQQQQRLNEYVQRLQQQQGEESSIYVPRDDYFQTVEYLRQQQQEQQQQQQQQTQLCPVCGVVMPLELNVCDFEIHVNSHFTD